MTVDLTFEKLYPYRMTVEYTGKTAMISLYNTIYITYRMNVDLTFEKIQYV